MESKHGRKPELIRSRQAIFGFVIIVSFLLLQFFTLRPSQAESTAVKPAPTPELFSLGKNLFEKQCSACHGMTGKGDGKAAYLLYPKPRDFTTNEFRLVSTSDMSATDEDLFKTVTRGMPGSSMPSWEHLSDKERWALVYYVRYLAEQKNYPGDLTWAVIEKIIKKQIDPAAQVQVTLEPAVTPEALQRGRDLFVKGCAACHGMTGKGDGQQLMKDNQGIPLKPRDLTAGIFKAASSSNELYYRIAGGIPGSPMPGYQAAFTDEQIWDLIHYVQTLPEKGKEEKSRLKRQQIRARKVAALDQDPLSGQWVEQEPVYVSLTPLWWRNDRIEGLEVRALHDGKIMGIHLVWEDPVENASQDAPQIFSDGAAVQLSRDADPPFFGMGNSESTVTLWHWKALWEKDRNGWQDINRRYPHIGIDYYPGQKDYQHGTAFESKKAKTRFQDPQLMTGWGAGNPLSDPEYRRSAEEAQAKGLGTLTTMAPQLEPVEASGVWKDGKWHLLFTRPLHPQEKERLDFQPGAFNIAFAVWDGEKRDRDGQKMISIWNELKVEEKEESR